MGIYLAKREKGLDIVFMTEVTHIKRSCSYVVKYIFVIFSPNLSVKKKG